MAPLTTLAAAAASSLLLVAPLPANAHSRITNIVINGTSYEGFNAKLPPGGNPDILVSWSTTATDDGWVNHESYQHPDIICHRDAVNAKGHARVAAGGTVDVQWQGWPESHKGPLLTSLAFCGTGLGACERVDKKDLGFFLVGEDSLLNPHVNAFPWSTALGLWASDEFIKNNATWTVQIPEDLAAGYYVMRQEWIALHFALDRDMSGPQHYPQCVNLQVTRGAGQGEGVVPDGRVPGMELYRLGGDGGGEGEGGQSGLDYDISTSPLPDYVAPGPTLWEGAATEVEQTAPTVTSTASATPGVPEIIMERGERDGTMRRAGGRGETRPGA